MATGCTRPLRAFFFALLLTGLSAFTASSQAAASAAPDAGADFSRGTAFSLGPGHWRLAISPGSIHFAPSAEHQSVYAIALERQRDDAWLWGGSYFSNSFGQPSGYVYLGQRFDRLLGQPQVFAQWTAGVMYGYRGQYQHKVPLNAHGFSPGLVPSLGWAFDDRFSTQINLLGTAGLMLQLSYDFR